DVKNGSLEAPCAVDGIVSITQRFSRRARMSEEERKAFDKDQKESEHRYNRQIADQFRTMIEEISGVLDKQELKDPTTGKTLGADKDDKVLLEQAQTFRLDQLDIRSPERQKHSKEAYQRH